MEPFECDSATVSARGGDAELALSTSSLTLLLQHNFVTCPDVRMSALSWLSKSTVVQAVRAAQRLLDAQCTHVGPVAQRIETRSPILFVCIGRLRGVRQCQAYRALSRDHSDSSSVCTV